MPRQIVFIGSTNEEDYLRDATGNRRFWPVLCGSIDIEAIRLARDLLWAESVHAYDNGARWWPEGPEENKLCKTEQDDRMQVDVWLEPISNYVDKGPVRNSVRIVEIFEHVLDPISTSTARADRKGWGQPEANRVARCLKMLGFKRSRKREDGERVYTYDRP